jgi:hypothetical protein
VLVRRPAVPLPRLGDARRFALGASTPWGRVPVQPRARGPRRHASQGYLRRQDAAGHAIGIWAGLNDFAPAPRQRPRAAHDRLRQARRAARSTGEAGPPTTGSPARQYAA